ncbi:hypothetical protein N656DRAFT_785218 [Canariomyces notabilis]|uniref:Protein kinase domain-containing protein n=1 Tax=Canariomyces notabilis TaxID=2074819 RepID=A0AAN6T7Z9_9PEZI|nr:hypothetical protein N656DRAFT_785218 [Canariomyces arenarius]
MYGDDELLLQNAVPPLKFRLGSQLVVAEKAELLDPHRTVYRLDLKPPPLLGLPPTVILKKRKADWEEEFEKEKQAYDVLKPIQGTIIPHFYGEAVYDGSPTLVLSFIVGKTLFELWRDLPENDLRQRLEEALSALTSYGVHYTDMKLDNFLMVNDGRVMVVDLEQVEFDTTTTWEESINSANVDSLIETLRMMRQYCDRSAARARQR